MTTTEKVKNYNGNNNFINSLKSGVIKYGKLTENQLKAAEKFFGNDVKLSVDFDKVVDTKIVNVDIKVSKFIAKKIKEDNKLEFAPFLLTISQVLGETNKAYKVVGKMTTSDVTSCRCCGKDLTDWRSQATGVGPTCSKHLNIPYVKKQEDVEVFKKMLKFKIDQIGDLTFWLAKSQIVDGGEDLSKAIK